VRWACGGQLLLPQKSGSNWNFLPTPCSERRAAHEALGPTALRVRQLGSRRKFWVGLGFADLYEARKNAKGHSCRLRGERLPIQARSTWRSVGAAGFLPCAPGAASATSTAGEETPHPSPRRGAGGRAWQQGTPPARRLARGC
jgi:hypothetical protein